MKQWIYSLSVGSFFTIIILGSLSLGIVLRYIVDKEHSKKRDRFGWALLGFIFPSASRVLRADRGNYWKCFWEIIRLFIYGILASISLVIIMFIIFSFLGD